MPWKSELNAILGARHGGRTALVLSQLVDLDQRYPNVGEIQYQLAWSLDTLGRQAEAIPHYEKSLALGLPTNELSGALLGLGSALRSLGQAERSLEILDQGKAMFPEHREFDVFRALSLHELGRSSQALSLLLLALADTSEDVGLTAHQRVLRHHAKALSDRAATT